MSRTLDGHRLLSVAGLPMRRVDLCVALGLALLSGGLILMSLTIGTTPVRLADLLPGAARNEAQTYAITALRLPRALIGFLAGLAVAISGAMLQTLTRNPIADPGLLGLSQGTLLAIMAMLVMAPALPSILMPLAGCAGGLAVALFLSRLTGRGRGGDALAILLLGIAVETTLSSVTAIVILYTPEQMSHAISVWLAGSLPQAGWGALAAMLPWLLLALPVLYVAGPMLRLLDLDEERAISLGLSAGPARMTILAATVLLTSASVAATGPLAFLGIMAPHLATALRPATGRARLVLSGLVGGAFVVAADLLSRALGTQIGLPVGLCLTLLGVPLFILILRLRALRPAA